MLVKIPVGLVTMADVKVAAWRERRALSQRDLARLANVSQFSISRIETGKQRPRPSTLRKLAKALSLSPEQLFLSPDTVQAQTQADP